MTKMNDRIPGDPTDAEWKAMLLAVETALQDWDHVTIAALCHEVMITHIAAMSPSIDRARAALASLQREQVTQVVEAWMDAHKAGRA